MVEVEDIDIARVREAIGKRRLEFYRPYRKQQEFHRAAGEFRETLLRAGNQCNSAWCFIETDGPMRLSSEVFFEKGANVLSWGGESECVSRISGGHLKGIEPAFRVVMESGHFFDCSSSHQILTSHGYCRIDQLMSQSNGLYLLHKDEGLQASYVEYGYLDGQQLQSVEDIGQEPLPSSGDVRQRNLSFSLEDAEERIRRYTSVFGESGLHSTFEGGPLQRQTLFDLFSAPKVQSAVLPLTDLHRNALRLVSVTSSRLQSYGESLLLDAEVFSLCREQVESSGIEDMIAHCVWLSQSSLQFPSGQNQDCSIQLLNHDVAHKLIFYPFQSPILVGGGKIVSYVPLGFQPIIDCQVPDVNNYKCAGVYHHNCGKTLSAAANTAIHATGKYPLAWWEGKVLKKAPVIWCAGVTGEVVRDSIQKLLIGDSANPGTGFIPLEDIIETTPSRGVADLIDTIYVKHVSGGKTRIRLKYYEQGREKFQADTVDMVWLDEEPPLDIYTEALTRTNATKGFLYMTFTPLKGMSEVVRKFLHEKSPDRCDINMTIEDALHIAPEERKRIIESYPLHERSARINGHPVLGSGRIFPIAEEDIACDPFDINAVPYFWMEIAGMDFGWDHPTAAVKMLYNPQDDIIYITNTYRRNEQTPIIHAAALRAWGENIPWAWPHDGLIHDKNSGKQLSVAYQELGLNMMAEHAKFENGSNSVEAGLSEMLMRMQTGRLKVFRHLSEWFEEFRLYHRIDGKVKKEYDDLLAASRYALMTLRNAARISKPVGIINGYRIEDEEKRHTARHLVDYNPLSREICRNIKR